MYWLCIHINYEQWEKCFRYIASRMDTIYLCWCFVISFRPALNKIKYTLPVAYFACAMYIVHVGMYSFYSFWFIHQQILSSTHIYTLLRLFRKYINTIDKEYCHQYLFHLQNDTCLQQRKFIFIDRFYVYQLLVSIR